MKAFYKLIEGGAVQSDSGYFEGATELDIDINDIGYLRMINGHLQVDAAVKNAAISNASKKAQINTIDKWFVWYDNQVSQAQRAQRTNTSWTANDGVKIYTTLAELDAEANTKQNQIRALREQLA